MTTIDLQSNDGQIFKVNIEAAKMSTTIHTMLMDLHIGKDGEVHEIKDPVPLPNVDAAVLKKILEWCKKKYKTDRKLQDKKEGQGAAKYTQETKDHQIYEVKGWEKDFINSINSVDKDGKSMLFDVSIAANYLNIQSLVDITTMEIARLMKDKNGEEIRDLFKLTHPDAKPKGPMKSITMQSSDGRNFVIDAEAAKMSIVIRKMLEDLDKEGSDGLDDILPVLKCDAAVMTKVISWCEKHKYDIEPDDVDKREFSPLDDRGDPEYHYELEDWDKKFIESINGVTENGESMMFDMIIAANYLDIPGLNHLIIKEVARMMRGKSQEEIRDLWKLKDDKLIGDEN